MQNPQYVKLAAATLKQRMPSEFFYRPACGVILGTGLSALHNHLGAMFKSVPFSEIPHFPIPGIASHAGAFSFGMYAGLPILIQQGRCHLYEGRSPEEVCMGVRVMALLGCQTLVITNAAGALNPLFEVGSLMCIADIINFTGQSPLTGPDYLGDRFPDMSATLDPALRKLAACSALKLGISLMEGVYIQVHGPEMETPAETRMYRNFGADAIGMSTVLEIIAAREMGLRCLGISCLTNKNLPDCMQPAPLAEVLRVAAESGIALAMLLKSILDELARDASSCQAS